MQYPKEVTIMKKLITMAIFTLATLTAGLAYAYDVWNTGTADKFYGDTSPMALTVVPGAQGAAAGGIRVDTATKDADGSAIFDSMLTTHPDVLFDSYPAPAAVLDSTKGKAAGGIREDTNKGTIIFDDLLKPKVNTDF
jgi:hypothetical protein